MKNNLFKQPLVGFALLVSSLPMFAGDRNPLLEEAHEDAIERLTQSLTLSEFGELAGTTKTIKLRSIDGDASVEFGQPYLLREVCADVGMDIPGDVFHVCHKDSDIRSGSTGSADLFDQSLVTTFQDIVSLGNVSTGGFIPFTVFQDMPHPNDGSLQGAAIRFFSQTSLCLPSKIEGAEKMKGTGDSTFTVTRSGPVCRLNSQ